VVAEVDAMAGLDEHGGPGDEELGPGGGVVGRVRWTLGKGDVPGFFHESLEAFVGDLEAIRPEAANGHTVRRRLLGILVIRTHQEFATRNPDHVAVGWRARRVRLRGDEWLLIIGTPALQGSPSSRVCRIGKITSSSHDGGDSGRSGKPAPHWLRFLEPSTRRRRCPDFRRRSE